MVYVTTYCFQGIDWKITNAMPEGLIRTGEWGEVLAKIYEAGRKIDFRILIKSGNK